MFSIFHCFFEQSGTFKNEFIKLGYDALDYDIKNDFQSTDCVIDLFREINNAYDSQSSIFDKIAGGGCDTIIAFFPCIRFAKQSIMMFQGTQWQLRNKSIEDKLQYDIQLHNELNELYCNISKLVIVCIRKNIHLIIENPYMTDHYLARYWAIKPQIIDWDRRQKGDYYKKPTQFYFINRKPSQNMILEPQIYNDSKNIVEECGWKEQGRVERSIISSDYARRFIKEFIL